MPERGPRGGMKKNYVRKQLSLNKVHAEVADRYCRQDGGRGFTDLVEELIEDALSHIDKRLQAYAQARAARGKLGK